MTSRNISTADCPETCLQLSRETSQGTDADEGSVGLLCLGLVVLLIMITATVLAISSVAVEQRKLQLLSDECADASASTVRSWDQIRPNRPQPVLDAKTVTSTTELVIRGVPHGIDRVQIASPTGLSDPRTAEVTLTAMAHPALIGIFIPDGVAISASSHSRVVVAE